MYLIIAIDPLGGIGYKNSLPWPNIKGDLPRFKKLTKDGKIIMGRKTWESLPVRPLKDRLNFVVSTTKQDNVSTITIADLKFPMFDDAWLIGGASLIKHCWNLIDEIHLTRVNKFYVCDVYLDCETILREFWLDTEEIYPDHKYQIWRRK